MIRAGWLLLAPLVLAGCGGDAPQDAPGEDAPAAVPLIAATTEAGVIPAAMRGRWGLTAADCDPARADAEGLLEVGATTLGFYESAGTLTGMEQAGADTLRASFAFTGEGMEWQRDMALELEDGGTTLVRRDFGSDAAPGALRYTRCSGE